MPISGRAAFIGRALVVAGLAAATLTGCDAGVTAPVADGSPRQVSVVGEGEVQGVPDTLTANVGIEFTAPDATGAMNLTSGRRQEVIDALIAAGVERKDISTTGVSLQPDYTTTDVDTRITGYVASNTIDVRIRQLDNASRALAVIVTTGGDATRINSVSYSIDDDSQLVKDARERAFNDAKDRAGQYAQLSGLTLGTVISISESASGQVQPPQPFERDAVAASVPLEPGEQPVSFSVAVVWELL